jgi:hypothetical protein
VDQGWAPSLLVVPKLEHHVVQEKTVALVFLEGESLVGDEVVVAQGHDPGEDEDALHIMIVPTDDVFRVDLPVLFVHELQVFYKVVVINHEHA